LYILFFFFHFCQGCCSETDALAAGGQLELISREEMEDEILKNIPELQIKIGKKLVLLQL